MIRAEVVMLGERHFIIILSLEPGAVSLARHDRYNPSSFLSRRSTRYGE
jgi:hypothetical protein